MTVLIVEDNAGVRRLLRRTLTSVASEIRECCDGEEALAVFAEFLPEVVLMDIRMPRVDGLAATRQITNAYPSARVVMVTDYDDEELKEAAHAAGASAYALKHDLVELPALLARLMGLWRK